MFRLLQYHTDFRHTSLSARIHYSNIKEPFPYLMSNETEAGTQTLDSSSDTIDIRLRQDPGMDIQGIKTSADELTLGSIDERIKQVTDPILTRAEELCVLLADRTEKESAGNSEASGSRCDNASASPSHSRYDSNRLLLKSSRYFYVKPQI